MGAKAKRSAPVRPRRLRTWLEHHVWSVRASVRHLAERPLGSVLTVTVMGLALALPVVFWLVLSNAQQLAGTAVRSHSISVFMQVDVDADAAAKLAAQVRKRSDVAGVATRSPDQGLAELTSMQGFAQAAQVLDTNPLPWVLIVTPLAKATPDQVHALATALQGMDQVDQVQDNAAWQRRLQSLLAVGQRAGLLLALLLTLAALMVVGNGIRLEVEERAAEIGVLKLVGASPAFIRRSYVYTGVWYGLAGGLLALLLTGIVEWALAGPVHALVASYGSQWAFGALPLQQLVWVPLVAAGLGWSGARVVSGYWLRRVV